MSTASEILNPPSREEILRQAEAQKAHYKKAESLYGTDLAERQEFGRSWEHLSQEYTNGRIPGTKVSRTERIATSISDNLETRKNYIKNRGAKGLAVDAGKTAFNATKGYVENTIYTLNPFQLVKEGWVWNGGHLVGVGAGWVLLNSGALLTPYIGSYSRAGTGLALSVGVDVVVNKGWVKNEHGNRFKKGVSAGLGHYAIFEALHAFSGEAAVQHFVAEGAKMLDWTAISNEAGKVAIEEEPKLKVGNTDINKLNPSNMVKSLEDEVRSHVVTQVEAPRKLIQPDASLLNPVEVIEQPIPEVAAPIEAQTTPGITTIEFPTVDMDGNDRPSLRGLVKAKLIGSGYGIGEVKPDSEGVTVFDPKDGKQVEAGLLELENNPDAQDKIKARMNFFIHQNSQRIGAFSVDPVTQIVNGETLARGYVDDNGVTHLTKYTDLTPKAEQEFYQSGEWKNWVNMPGIQIMDENTVAQNFQWAPQELSQEPDPIYSKVEPEELGIRGTYLKPENMQDGLGRSQAIVAESHYGIKDGNSHFDATNPEHIDALHAKWAQDPLHIYREELINQQLHADSKKAFFKILDPETGEMAQTDLLVSVQPDGSPTKLITYENYRPMLKTLVNEVADSGAFDGRDPYIKYTIGDADTVLSKTAEGLGIDNAYPARTLAESIYRDFNLEEIAGENEEKKEQILKALILYIKENHSESYFAGEDLVRFRSPNSGVMLKFKVPKEEILRKIMAKVV